MVLSRAPKRRSNSRACFRPPPEIAAAGDDRCIIPIKEEKIDAWLNPDPKNLDAMQAILEDRARPYYEHRMAA